MCYEGRTSSRAIDSCAGSASIPIRYRQSSPFWAWGLTWNFLQRLFLWKYRLRMRTMVDLEKIIWRTSKAFVFGNGYNIVLATKPTALPASVRESLRTRAER